MNCDKFEMLLADAIGEELADTDRTTFEGHLAMCEKCREEYRTAIATVRTLRTLPSTTRVSSAIDRDVALPFASGAVKTRYVRPWVRVMRYAASVLLAFTAGYGAHGLGGADFSSPSTVVFQTGVGAAERPTFGKALAGNFRRDRGRSDLARGLIAMFPSNP